MRLRHRSDRHTGVATSLHDMRLEFNTVPPATASTLYRYFNSVHFST